ncbi:hypothetical protein V5O48_017729 [Marasmius crinis-equi]|uniref:Nephrocystin 3-like N-terminal domain-containing protein n=1 Tax=Marasmius crinis-equi TaxID=585013 RepID=A0ABR3EN64_9AGAR
MVVHGPTSIALIKPQQIDLLGGNPDKFTLVVKNKGGDTLKETKWDADRGGWPVDIVQNRGLDTENLSIELREARFSGLLPGTIASGSLTMDEMVAAIQASQDQLEMSIAILSQNGLSNVDKELALIVEIRIPTFLPVWINSIALAETVDDLTDQTLRTLDLIFKTSQGKKLKKSTWDSSRKCWDVNLPQFRGAAAAEHLSIELCRRRRTGLRKSLATVTLNIDESEQAMKESRKEIRKVCSVPPRNGLNVDELVLTIKLGALDMPPSDMDRIALPRSVAQIVENTSVITDVLEKLSGMLQKKCEVDEQLVDLVDSMNQLYGCAIVKDALKNYAAFRVLFDAMIQQSVECFLFISNYVSNGYLSEICFTTVPASACVPVLKHVWAGHMTTVSRTIARFQSSFENLKDRFNNDLLRTNTIINIETKDLIVGLHESLQQLGNRSCLTFPLHKPYSSVCSDKKLDLHEMKRVLEEELKTTQFQLPSDLPRCLLGTRQHTLSKILDWIVRGKQSLLWLSGVAGSGKSSVMATLHDYLDEMGCSSHLAAYIRYRRSSFESPSKFVQALIYQLATFDSHLGMEIAKALKGNILHSPLSRQLQSLFIQPLKKYKPKIEEETQIVVLIDGLDECMQEAGGSNAFHELLALLSHLASSNTFHTFPFLRFVVASRPEEPIHTAFMKSSTPDSNSDHHPNILHFRLDTSSSETTADIFKYLTVKLTEIFRRNDKFRQLCKQENAVPRLAQSSHGLFIWANVIVDFLRLTQNRERLQLALNITIPKDASAFDVLKELYGTVLNSVAAEHGDKDVKSQICTLLGLVIVIGRVKAGSRFLPGLTETILHGLLTHLDPDKADDIVSLLPRLGAVIEGVHSPDAELFLLHKSLEDYLTDESRAGDVWYIDLKGHWIPKVAECCIHMVHSDVFGDTTKASDLLSFAHHYWIFAFLAQLNPNCPFSTEVELSPGTGKEIFYATYFGLSYARDITKQTPKIVGEAIKIIRAWHPSILVHLDETPTLRKHSLPQFSSIASGSQDFFTILHAIESVTQHSADILDWLRPTDMLEHNGDDNPVVLQISGVPSRDVLEEMIEELSDTDQLDLSHYPLPLNTYSSDNDTYGDKEEVDDDRVQLHYGPLFTFLEDEVTDEDEVTGEN